MIGRICLLLEALSIVICLHHLYGKKFKLDIATLSLLAIDMIMMTTIDYFGWPSTLSITIYPIIAVYCGIEFGFEWKKIIINNILYMIIVSGAQLAISLGYYYLFSVRIYSEIDLLIVNAMTLLLISCLYYKNILKNFSEYLQSKSEWLIVILIISVIGTGSCLILYKGIDKIELGQAVLLLMGIILVCILVAQIGKYRIRAKEVETELKMHELYAESFEALIENVRIRQHEFDNHLNTIYSMHLLCSSFEELVEMQQSQCKELEKDNRYNKLLKNDNHIIRSFLYTNFLKAEKFGIKVSYEIVLDKLEIKMPIYKLVEILGDLINNAVEAMMDETNIKWLHVSIIEMEQNINIEVRNTSKYISRNDISKFFMKGYSKKGINRGWGLYNVKKICDEYGYEISCDNIQIDEQNWLAFMILK